MIRAFGLSVGITIAIRGPASLNLHAIFGPAFWLGFLLHAALAELWIQATRIANALPQMN